MRADCPGFSGRFRPNSGSWGDQPHRGGCTAVACGSRGSSPGMALRTSRRSGLARRLRWPRVRSTNRLSQPVVAALETPHLQMGRGTPTAQLGHWWTRLEAPLRRPAARRRGIASPGEAHGCDNSSWRFFAPGPIRSWYSGRRGTRSRCSFRPRRAGEGGRGGRGQRVVGSHGGDWSLPFARGQRRRRLHP